MTIEYLTPDWPAPANVAAGTTLRGADAPENAIYLNQVHGATVVDAADVRAASSPVDADAVVGRETGDQPRQRGEHRQVAPVVSSSIGKAEEFSLPLFFRPRHLAMSRRQKMRALDG